MASANPKGEIGWLHAVIQRVFVPESGAVNGTWAVFFIPAAILAVWILLDWWLIKDTPEEANFPHFDTHDASSGQMHVELSTLDLLKKVFASPLMLMIAFIELTSGALRNGVMTWYFIFADQVNRRAQNLYCKTGVCCFASLALSAGFAGGIISDKFYQSRRGPPAVILGIFMFMMTLVMAIWLFSSPLTVGLCALLITTAVIGVHSLMSGTAAADFGGRKATATCSGIVDGFVYLGTGIQSVSLGYLTSLAGCGGPVF